MLAKALFTTVPGSILLASIIVSTSILVGAQPFGAFKSVIDQRLSQ